MERISVVLLFAGMALSGCGGGGGSSGGGGSTGPSGGGPVSVPLGFTDLTDTVGFPESRPFAFETSGDLYAGGLSAADYDADGDIDIYVVRGLNDENVLLQNQGNGTYVDVAAAVGLNMISKGSGPVFADIDGDGDLDLFVGSFDDYPYYVMRNDDGVFTDVTVDSGILLTFVMASVSATFADYDNDDDLDLFLTHWNTFSAADSELLWRNNGDGTFENVTVQAGLSPGGDGGSFPSIQTLTHNLSDLDQDGDLDLLMAADFNTSQVFMNNGDGTFELTTDTDVITDDNGMGASVGDYDNDGDMDWFVTSIFGMTLLVEGNDGTGNRLYRNDGNGVFEDVTAAAGVTDGHWGWGSCFADFDLDTVLDIVHVNGWPDPNFDGDPVVFFRGNGNGTFTEMAVELGLIDNGQGRGIACYDADRDGDLDIIISSNQPEQLTYYRNDVANGNHYLGIKLVSPSQNTSGVGAWITLTSSLGSQVREVRAGSNYVSQNPTEVHFGLGSATTADIEVRWPDGSLTSMTTVAADQLLTITQQ